jgi:antitoxin MazE
MGSMMKVSRWGNSLAVRLPADLVRQLGLKEGDYVERDRLALYKARPKMSREEALEVMRKSRWKLPADYKFDREEANAR